MSFEVNDVVDVIDRRDGAAVARGATILELTMETLPGREEPSQHATLSCGFAVSVRCLRPATVC